MDAIRDFLNQAITQKGTKQKYISEKTGINEDTLSKILLGKRRI